MLNNASTFSLLTLIRLNPKWRITFHATCRTKYGNTIFEGCLVPINRLHGHQLRHHIVSQYDDQKAFVASVHELTAIFCPVPNVNSFPGNFFCVADNDLNYAAVRVSSIHRYAMIAIVSQYWLFLMLWCSVEDGNRNARFTAEATINSTVWHHGSVLLCWCLWGKNFPNRKSLSISIDTVPWTELVKAAGLKCEPSPILSFVFMRRNSRAQFYDTLSINAMSVYSCNLLMRWPNGVF